MSDTTPNTSAAPEAPAPSPAAPSAPATPDSVTVALRSLQADNATLVRDLKTRDEKLAAADAELVQLRAQIDGFGKRKREGANVAKLRTALPHLDEFAARAALLAFHEDGKVDRYSDKPDEVAAKAVELLTSSASALARPPAPGGGANRAPPQTPARTPHKSLI